MTPASTLAPFDMKRWSTLQAQLALAGFAAVRIESDDGSPLVVVSRWALTRSFESLDELARFVGRATRVGAPAA